MPTGHMRRGRERRARRGPGEPHRTTPEWCAADDSRPLTVREVIVVIWCAKAPPSARLTRDKRSRPRCPRVPPAASIGRRPARAPRAGPAGRGHGATGPGALRRARGLGEDDDPGREGRVARGRRRGARFGHAWSRSTGGPQRSSPRGWTPRSSRSAPVPGRSVSARSTHSAARCSHEAGVPIEPLVDRDAMLRDLFPEATAADRGRLDLAFSRLKLDLRVSADEVAADPSPGPIASAFVAYERAVAEGGGVDFDDLVVRALRLLRDDDARLATLACEVREPARRRGAGPGPHAARARAPARGAGRQRLPCRRRRPDDLRLAARGRPASARPRGLAARHAAGRPRDQLPLPASGRRAGRPPRRAQPGAVREADPRRARGDRPHRPRAGLGRRPRARRARDPYVARGRLDPRGARPDEPRAARGDRGAVEARVPFRAPDLPLPIEDERLDGILDAGARLRGSVARSPAARHRSGASARTSGQRRRRRTRRRAVAWSPPTARPRRTSSPRSWAGRPPWASIDDLAAAIRERRAALAELRRDDAALTLATAHGTKGLEWDHVLVLADGFPGGGRSATRRSPSGRSRRSGASPTSRGRGPAAR